MIGEHEHEPGSWKEIREHGGAEIVAGICKHCSQFIYVPAKQRTVVSIEEIGARLDWAGREEGERVRVGNGCTAYRKRAPRKAGS